MVINSVSTIELENIQVYISSNRIRQQSVPVLSRKSSVKQSPTRVHRERQRPIHRQIFIPDKPSFVNYASAYVNPYRSLTPILIKHEHSHRQRRKRSKSKKSIVEDEIVIPSDLTEPIDLWPLNPNNFDMDFLRQRQIVIENSFYRERIDAWQGSSIEQLIQFIKEFLSNKTRLDFVWCIFYWISQNIVYEIDIEETNIERIFRSKKTNSQGYAMICQYLCQQMGIPCLNIDGYVKDIHFQQSQPNHTWNVVELRSHQWYLLDSAWGSGYFDSNNEYKKSLQTFFFLTRPETMIYHHLPKESQWQLLSKPISFNDYIRLPYFHSYYFLFNLTLISPRFSNLVHFDSYESLAEILIQAPNDIQLICLSKHENRSRCLTQYDSNRQIWQCLFAPYKSGFYTLIIYANRLSISNLFFNAIELNVQISIKDFQKRRILPLIYGKFLEYKCQIYSPLDRILKYGMRIFLHCRIPYANYGRLTLDGNWLDEIEIKDEIFKQEIIVPQQEIILYAQLSPKKKNSNSYFALVRYLVEK